jgi:hypothetical protein
MRSNDPEAVSRLACFSKRRYDVMQRARGVAARMNGQSSTDHPVVAYECHLCGGYHVGRKPNED